VDRAFATLAAAGEHPVLLGEIVAGERGVALT
jgi:hypothetical protein